MPLWTDNNKRNRITETIFCLLVFSSIMCFAMIQPYGDPPDEINRFKVVNYICNHGSLPRGDDPEVILDGYGASYAFQPILTYIIQGFLLRFLKLFTSDGYILLLAARMVNVAFGVLMAWFVRRIAREAWDNPYLQWAFTLLVVFLPQNIFIHSYVNTDSMAMLSVAMIFYVLLRAQRTGYDRRDCVLLAVGIILCAMSYYNAYGMVLAAILVFVAEFIHFGEKASDAAGTATGGGRRGLWVEWQPLLEKGGLISVLVLVGIGWWFIRNGILYGGDIIAMNARRECAILTATEEFNPLTRFTYQGAGKPLSEMLFGTGYITLLRDSFVAMFGPMLIPTHGLIYIGYQWLWTGSCIAAVLPLGRLRGFRGWLGGASSASQAVFGQGLRKQLLSSGKEKAENYPRKEKKERNWWLKNKADRKSLSVFYGSMVLFCTITVGLSIYYSYSWEYQPQGRYILPVLIPFMFLVTLGLGKLSRLLGGWLCVGTMAYVMLAFAYSLFDRFLPYYMSGENLFSMYGKAFVP